MKRSEPQPHKQLGNLVESAQPLGDATAWRGMHAALPTVVVEGPGVRTAVQQRLRCCAVPAAAGKSMHGMNTAI